jgi:hypothetical protein
LKVEVKLVPTNWNAVIAATAISAAIKPYSMAVAPFSFFKRLVNVANILALLWLTLELARCGAEITKFLRNQPCHDDKLLRFYRDFRRNTELMLSRRATPEAATTFAPSPARQRTEPRPCVGKLAPPLKLIGQVVPPSRQRSALPRRERINAPHQGFGFMARLRQEVFGVGDGATRGAILYCLPDQRQRHPQVAIVLCPDPAQHI